MDAAPPSPVTLPCAVAGDADRPGRGAQTAESPREEHPSSANLCLQGLRAPTLLAGGTATCELRLQQLTLLGRATLRESPLG